MSENWTRGELEAAVLAYLEMRTKELDNIPFKKKKYYVSLSERYGRSEKSYEYRMQNISYVFSTLGRRWVSGLKPAKNVGLRVAGEIERIINKLEGNPVSTISSFAIDVSSKRSKLPVSPPSGKKSPSKSQSLSLQYDRDPEVVAWVLEEAKGVCESCGSNAPFEKDDGTLFLEVHHLRMLSDGGSDTTTNTVAICPNCHRELHYGRNRLEKMETIYANVGRLIKE